MATRGNLDFREVKTSLSVMDILRAAGVEADYTVSPNGRRVWGICRAKRHVHGPTPNRDQFQAQLNDTADGPVWEWFCHGDCQSGGDVLKLVQEIHGCTYAQAGRWIREHFPHLVQPKKRERTPASRPVPAEAAHNQHTKPNEEPAAVKATEKKEAPEQPHKGACPKAPTAPVTVSTATAEGKSEPSEFKVLKYTYDLDYGHRYLTTVRGVAEATARAFSVGVCLNPKSQMKGRVLFPLFHPEQPDAVVGYLSRFAGEDFEAQGQAKWLLPAGFARSKVLFGWPQVLAADQNAPLIIVESVWSVLRLFPRYLAVATLGAQLSDHQAELVLGTRRNLVLMYDGDSAGLSGARLAAAKLITRQRWMTVVRLDEEEQPDQLNDQQLRSYLSFLSTSC